MRKNNAKKPLKKVGVSEKIRRISDRIPLSPETKHAARTAGEIGGHLGAIFAAEEGSGTTSALGILGHICALLILGVRWMFGGQKDAQTTMRSERNHKQRKDG